MQYGRDSEHKLYVLRATVGLRHNGLFRDHGLMWAALVHFYCWIQVSVKLSYHPTASTIHQLALKHFQKI